MYEVGIVTQFEAAHHLVGDFGPATRLHGHTYRMEVKVRGDRLRSDGTLFDITQLQEAVGTLMSALHYQNLTEVAGLVGVNTTAEAVANHCWETLAAHLTGVGLTSLLVQVWESPQAYAARDDRLPS
jgi:6-pyruvoyltetrahydropterin/6-carboxytetrahydropterin synthase